MTQAPVLRPEKRSPDDNRYWHEGQVGIGTSTTTISTTFGAATADSGAVGVSFVDYTGKVSLEPIVFRLTDTIPEEYLTHEQRFPSGRDASVTVERYEDGSWVASLQEDETVFSTGESHPDAIGNLIASARDDLDILREYGDRVDPSLVGRRQLLESLFA